jgi:integrase/recombinase XerD
MLTFIAARVRKQIDQLTVEDITVEQVRLFLQDLEQTRACSVATRNQRLAVIHALARFIAEHSPEHIEWCGILGTIPFKRAMKREITYLEQTEMKALLAAPDQRTPQGQRDYALLLFLYNTGARADEAAQLTIGNLELAHTPTRGLSSVQIHGKGNKLRRCPLWPHTANALARLVNERTHMSTSSSIVVVARLRALAFIQWWNAV